MPHNQAPTTTATAPVHWACRLLGHELDNRLGARGGPQCAPGGPQCARCGHPLQLAVDRDQHAADVTLPKKLQVRCALFGHPVHTVTVRDGFLTSWRHVLGCRGRWTESFWYTVWPVGATDTSAAAEYRDSRPDGGGLPSSQGGDMRPVHRLLAAAAVVVAGFVAGTLGATGAQAASDDISYTCDYSVGDNVGTGTATATFDSGITDGLVVPVGQSVSLDPFTGSITLPDGFTDALRTAGLASIHGSATVFLGIRENGDKLGEPSLVFDAEVPAEGPFTVQVSGEAGEYQPRKAGTYTLMTGSDLFFFTDPEGPFGDSGLTCGPEGGPGSAIDSFTATGASTATVTVTAAASPERPAVVQTDFADDSPTMPAPLIVGVGLLGLTGVAAAAGVTRRSRSRLH